MTSTPTGYEASHAEPGDPAAMMRALTVRQPWAWQIINQRKNIENRRTNFVGKYRGPVAIHAAKRSDMDALARLPKRAPEWVTAPRIFDYGVILGVVDLIDIHASVLGQCCGEWGEPESWHLVLANPRPIPLREQFACRGALGLWTPPADVSARLAAVADV